MDVLNSNTFWKARVVLNALCTLYKFSGHGHICEQLGVFFILFPLIRQRLQV